MTTAAVLSIGTELTRGELVNGNAAWIGAKLTSLGFEVVEHLTVDDDRGRIIDALERLAPRARVIVATGGLGPTTDDLTTDAVAAAIGKTLVRDDTSAIKIQQRFAAAGREMPDTNLKQADFPEGATILPNPVGTAPGFAVDVRTSRAFFMPGVPSEMRHLFEESVTPAIASLAERTSHQVHIRTFGMTESQVGKTLEGLEEANPGVTIGYRAHFPEIEVKVLARASSIGDAEALAKRVAAEVCARLGDAVYGDVDDTFPAVIGRMLRAKNLTLAIAESCTGGLVGEMVTSVPGASEYLLLDAVTYSNASKTAMLGVSSETLRAHGGVSGETAAAMAEGALRLASADLAIAVTGIAGPGGGTEEKPVGTVWFGLAQKGQPTLVKTRRLPGDRERIRTLSAYIALSIVGRAAMGRPISV